MVTARFEAIESDSAEESRIQNVDLARVAEQEYLNFIRKMGGNTILMMGSDGKILDDVKILPTYEGWKDGFLYNEQSTVFRDHEASAYRITYL